MLTFFEAPPSCFRRPSTTSATFPLPTFPFGALCCAIFVRGLFCSPTTALSLVGLTCSAPAIWSFSTSEMWALFLRPLRCSSCCDTVSFSFSSSLSFVAAPCSSFQIQLLFPLHFANFFVWSLLFHTINLNLNEGKLINIFGIVCISLGQNVYY